MYEFFTQPWPWYIGGPLIGLTVPLLLWLGGKQFGISSNLRHICSTCDMMGLDFFDYDWKSKGRWNLLFAAGVVIGGFIAGELLHNPEPVAISPQTTEALRALGVEQFQGYMPADLFNWSTLGSLQGIVMLGVGGFLVGFGARYAGGCTSGHAITGLANLQIASLVAVIGFFAGGLLITYLILPWLIG